MKVNLISGVNVTKRNNLSFASKVVYEKSPKPISQDVLDFADKYENNRSKIAFTSNLLLEAGRIEKVLLEEGMKCDFKDNDLVAKCTQKTVELFKELFGSSSLPKIVGFTSFKEKFTDPKTQNWLGAHQHYKYGDSNEIWFNSDYDFFDSELKLQLQEIKEKLKWWSPTANHLQLFVHEFGHSAHFKNLYINGNADVMSKLNKTKIPTSIGQLIAKCKLGRYSAENMNEFMAERITKDVCNNLDSNDKFTGSLKDLDYANIFSNRWQYRYSTPQSYLDYYTQQVWNGDIKKAEEVANDVAEYLETIQAKEVLPVVETIKEKAPQKTFLYSTLESAENHFRRNCDIEKALFVEKIKNKVSKRSIFAELADSLFDFNKETTKKLDERNDLMLRNKIER